MTRFDRIVFVVLFLLAALGWVWAIRQPVPVLGRKRCPQCKGRGYRSWVGDTNGFPVSAEFSGSKVNWSDPCFACDGRGWVVA